MSYLGRPGATAPLTSADIPDNSITTAKIVDDNVTAAKIPAGAVSSDVLYLENNTSTQTLSGTYSTERLYFNDSYQLTGNVTVTGHLALGTIADEDVVITQDSTERTITGSGTLEAGNVLQDTHRTDLTDMTGTLANSVQDNVTRLGTVTTGTFNGTLDSTTFSGDAGQKTAKAWVNFNGNGTLAVRDSFGVSSVADDGTGEYSINLSTTLSTNACTVGGCDPESAAGSLYTGAMQLMMNTSSQIKCRTSNYSTYIIAGVLWDYHHIHIAVFGD